MKPGRKSLVWGIVCTILIVVIVVLFLNRRWCYDFIRGLGYSPSAEMSAIIEKLNLTEHGEFLMKASRPELLERDDFNSHCVSQESETAVLGCYTGETVYVYNITDQELDGIRELTTAHELLHAAYARLSSSDREAIQAELEKVATSVSADLKDELDNYDPAERAEELYVRAGTEVADLPESLEKHYAEIFRDQDLVASYYNKYISVFRAIEAELEKLEKELSDLSIAIDNQSAEYTNGSDQLNAEITAFNNCAVTAGCFTSQGAFQARRAALLAEQARLETIYNNISSMIDTYNAKVEQYNADVVRGESLNRKINSTAEPEKVK